MDDCLFCKIARHEIPSDIVYEDDRVICFRDVNPQAPEHVLLIPKEHIGSLDDVNDSNKELLGYMMSKIHEITDSLGIETGYRVVSNNGDDAEQSVKHLHFHILGKRKMTWPPG
ncbi:MAG: histidine triad nucleotide-binding protein [Eubacterium sp.]|jgi:diadenosine tetraphosphate (Ap4A) HIT family hydrolase